MSGASTGGCYVTAPSNVMKTPSVLRSFEEHCNRYDLSFTQHNSVIPPDNTTLFTTSGMQKHKPTFLNPIRSETFSDVQRCLRLNDLEEIGDGTHYLDFNMLGLFSFNDWSVQEGVNFWMDFCVSIGVVPDTVTIHPDCPHWTHLYDTFDVTVVFDPECKWSDGSIGGYCTEFYKDGVEIGNIVNPLGQHLDCGFGLERLEQFVDNTPPPNKNDVLYRTIEILLESEVVPSNSKQGYVLRKLIRLNSNGSLPNHPLVDKEQERIRRIVQSIPRWVEKHPNQLPEFFWETYGIHPDELKEFQ